MLPYYVQELQGWLKEYKREEKLVNKEMKEYEKAKKKGVIDAKIELTCPYCNANLGKTPIPSKRTTRKCKKCANAIHVEPNQKLFSSMFFNDRQSFWRMCLMS